MRHVFPSAMCAHVWSAQSQKDGWNSSRSVSFDGAVFFSYSTPIAAIVKDISGASVALISAENHGVTTAKHYHHVWSAWRGNGAEFTVPSLGAHGGRHYEVAPYGAPPAHAANLEYLVKLYRDAIESMKRARNAWYSPAERLAELADTAREYANSFGLTTPGLAGAIDAAAIETFRAEREARANTPAAIRKRAKGAEYRAAKEQRKKEQRAEENRIALLASAERIALWIAGDPRVSLRYHENRAADGSAMLRARGDILETSQGATVPIDHARRVFGIVARCRALGREFIENGHTVHVGHFTVKSIDKLGNLTAGCHYITWAEISRFADSQGWAITPAILSAEVDPVV